MDFLSVVGCTPHSWLVCFYVSLCVCVCCRQECHTALVRACWNEIFTLGLAQCSQVMNLSTILAAIVNHLQTSIQDGMSAVLCATCSSCGILYIESGSGVLSVGELLIADESEGEVYTRTHTHTHTH